MSSMICAASFPPPEPSDHPVDVGLRSEAAIVEALLRRGYSVSVPRGSNQRYDLIVDAGRLLRVQCKTGRLRDGTIVYSTQSVRSNMRGAFRRAYVGDIDYFAVHCPANDRVYMIPIEDSPGGHGRLRLAPTLNNQAVGVRWARDYELPEVGRAGTPTYTPPSPPE